MKPKQIAMVDGARWSREEGYVHASAAKSVDKPLLSAGLEEQLSLESGDWRCEFDGLTLTIERRGPMVGPRMVSLGDAYLMQVPLWGSGAEDMEGCWRRLPAAGTGQGSQASMLAEGRVQIRAHLVAKVAQRRVQECLQHMSVRSPRSYVLFSPMVSLRSHGCQELLSLLQFIFRAVTGKNGMNGSETVRRSLASLFVSALLTHMEHSQKRNLRPTPNRQLMYLASAIDYIFCHLRASLRPCDIAAEAKVSTRTLFSGFGHHLGTTPMEYVKNVRLDMVHRALKSPDPNKLRVARTARAFGFHHMGHFSSAYCSRFKELPSDSVGRFAVDDQSHASYLMGYKR